MKTNKKKVARGLLAAVLVAELAVLDYAAIELIRNGVAIEVSRDELLNAAEEAAKDMVE